MYYIRLISIFIILFILYYNSLTSNLLSSIILPVSITKITFLNDFLNDDENNPLEIFYIRKPMITWINFCDFKDIIGLLDILDHNKSYVITFDLVINQMSYESGDPSLNLGPPILISKDSNPWLLTEYLANKIGIGCNSYDLNDRLDIDNMGVLIKYKEINLFFK